MEYLSPGPNTFTKDDIHRIRRACKHRSSRKPGDKWSHFVCTEANGGEMYYPIPAQRDETHGMFFSSAERNSHFEEICHDLFAAVQEPEHHVARLDSILCRLFDCDFVISEPEDEIVERACKLLSRLPAAPISPLGVHTMGVTGLDTLKEYRLHSAKVNLEAQDSLHTWESLRVVAFVDTNLIRLVLNYSRD